MLWLALAVVALTAIVLVVAFAVRYRVADFAIVCAILVSGAVDLPRRISTGPITGSSDDRVRRGTGADRPTNEPGALRWPAFFRWMLVYSAGLWLHSLGLARGRRRRIQNVLVVGAFVAAIYVTGCRISDPRFRRGVEHSTRLPVGGHRSYGVVLLVAGIEVQALLRPFALFAVDLRLEPPRRARSRPNDAVLALTVRLCSTSRGASALRWP